MEYLAKRLRDGVGAAVAAWRWCLVPAMNFCLAGAAAAQDFRAGLSAYRIGDHAAAEAYWQPLAEAGHADAQAALGYLYFTGPVGARDSASAARWYRRAAAQGQVDSLYFLGMQYLDGRGIPKDHLGAYVFCERALFRGVAKALRCRDAAEHGLTEGRLRQAKRYVVEGIPRPLGGFPMNRPIGF